MCLERKFLPVGQGAFYLETFYFCKNYVNIVYERK